MAELIVVLLVGLACFFYPPIFKWVEFGALAIVVNVVMNKIFD